MLRRDTTREQRFDESFCEAWDRFKDLLHACPHHGFTELHQLDTFYNALTPTDQDSLNAAAGGNLLTKTPRDALTIIENKSKVHNSRNKPIVSKFVYRGNALHICFIGCNSSLFIEVMHCIFVLSGAILGENDQEDEQQEQGEVISQNTSNRKKICAKKNKATSKREAAADTENDEQTSRPKKTSKKVVEKLVSSKKAKKVAVESELVPEDNDALVSADEEEVET
ncbi:hypothetical protein Tco_1468405, partial [Tanacetum coccineum]